MTTIVNVLRELCVQVELGYTILRFVCIKNLTNYVPKNGTELKLSTEVHCSIPLPNTFNRGSSFCTISH